MLEALILLGTIAGLSLAFALAALACEVAARLAAHWRMERAVRRAIYSGWMKGGGE